MCNLYESFCTEDRLTQTRDDILESTFYFQSIGILLFTNEPSWRIISEHKWVPDIL